MKAAHHFAAAQKVYAACLTQRRALSPKEERHHLHPHKPIHRVDACVAPRTAAGDPEEEREGCVVFQLPEEGLHQGWLVTA